MLTIKTTTYGCACGYKVDANLFENKRYFESKYDRAPYGTCPSCLEGQLARLLDMAEVSTHTVLEQDDLDEMTIPEINDFDMPVMVDSGQTKQSIGIVDGQPAIVETPVMVEKRRELTNEEKQEKLADAQRSLDTLESLAVQEVSPTKEN